MSKLGISFHIEKYFSLRQLSSDLEGKDNDASRDINGLALKHLKLALSSDVATHDDVRALLTFACHWKPRRFRGNSPFSRALRLALTGKPG